MAATCEVCGRIDESAADEHLQVCSDCIDNLRLPDPFLAGTTEDAAD